MPSGMFSLSARIAFWGAGVAAYILALLPGDPHIFHYDKFNHMLAFAMLAVLGRLGHSHSRAVVIAIGLIAFGGLIELTQALPAIHRDASWADLGADAVATIGGLLIGTALLGLARSWRTTPTA